MDQGEINLFNSHSKISSKPFWKLPTEMKQLLNSLPRSLRSIFHPNGEDYIVFRASTTRQHNEIVDITL